jgi:Uma2 family endonuclease
MTITQTDIASLQQAIRQLSRSEREELAEWILNNGDFNPEIREAAEKYSSTPSRLLTVEEYLDLDEESVRYEYIAGQIFAMSNPTGFHEMVASNLFYHFQHQLRGTPCRAFAAHAKVHLKVDDADIFYQPDVLVSCGPFTTEVLEKQFLTSPCIIAEVLSPSTEAIDRREKSLNYRHLPSVEEFLLVAPRTMHLTVFRRSEQWKPRVLTKPDELFESCAVQVRVALADIYDGLQ